MKSIYLLTSMATLIVNASMAQVKHENAKYGYKVEVPSDWSIYAKVEDDPENHASILDWGLPKVYSKLEKTSIENAISVTAYKRGDIKSLEDLEKFEFNRIANVLESKEAAGHEPFPSFVISSVRNGHTYKSKTAFAFKNNVGYVFAYTATPGTYDINLPKFEAFLKTVEFTTQVEPISSTASNSKINTTGIYLAKTSTIQAGSTTLEIYNYIRFDPDGTVYTQSVSGYAPEKVITWLGKNGRFERKGKYTMSGTTISFTVTNDESSDKEIEGPKKDIYSGKLSDDGKLFLETKYDSGTRKDAWYEFFKN